MRAWLYYRLSRDEDKELNSLTNQKNILVEYAENNGYTVVGESFDDNVSGMHFNREGIEKIYDEVEKKTIDAVIVKDYCAIIGLNQKIFPASADTKRRRHSSLTICGSTMCGCCR